MKSVKSSTYDVANISYLNEIREIGFDIDINNMIKGPDSKSYGITNTRVAVLFDGFDNPNKEFRRNMQKLKTLLDRL